MGWGVYLICGWSYDHHSSVAHIHMWRASCEATRQLCRGATCYRGGSGSSPATHRLFSNTKIPKTIQKKLKNPSPAPPLPPPTPELLLVGKMSLGSQRVPSHFYHRDSTPSRQPLLSSLPSDAKHTNEGEKCFRSFLSIIKTHHAGFQWNYHPAVESDRVPARLVPSLRQALS